MSTNIAKADGRVERTAATRKNILDVTRQLILAGDTDPTAKAIAQAANITTRTLFRHFPDMASLQHSFIESAQAEAAAVMDEAFPEDAPAGWKPLLDQLVDRRARVYESLLPIYISLFWSRFRDGGDSGVQRAGVARRRRRLKVSLPEAVASDADLFEAIDGLLSIEYWVSLRRDQRLSATRSVQVVRLALTKLTQ